MADHLESSTHKLFKTKKSMRKATKLDEPAGESFNSNKVTSRQNGPTLDSAVSLVSNSVKRKKKRKRSETGVNSPKVQSVGEIQCSVLERDVLSKKKTKRKFDDDVNSSGGNVVSVSVDDGDSVVKAKKKRRKKNRVGRAALVTGGSNELDKSSRNIEIATASSVKLNHVENGGDVQKVGGGPVKGRTSEEVRNELSKVTDFLNDSLKGSGKVPGKVRENSIDNDKILVNSNKVSNIIKKAKKKKGRVNVDSGSTEVVKGENPAARRTSIVKKSLAKTDGSSASVDGTDGVSVDGGPPRKAKKKGLAKTDDSSASVDGTDGVSVDGGPPRKAKKKSLAKTDDSSASVDGTDGVSVDGGPPRKAKKKSLAKTDDSSASVDGTDGVSVDGGPPRKAKKKGLAKTDDSSASVDGTDGVSVDGGPPRKAKKKSLAKTDDSSASVDGTDGVSVDDGPPRKAKKKRKKDRKKRVDSGVNSSLNDRGGKPSIGKVGKNESDSILKAEESRKSTGGSSVQQSKIIVDVGPSGKKKREKFQNSKNSTLRERMLSRLSAARFRYINEELYTWDGQNAPEVFSSDPSSFKAYHSGFKQQTKLWPINPIDVIIKSIKKMDGFQDRVIADFGCGEAKLAAELSTNRVYSFDLVAVNDRVTVCDNANTKLYSGSVDIAVHCLSLMSSNISGYIREANRVLRVGGLLKIAEVESRFDNVDKFVEDVCKFNFKLLKKDLSHNLFYFMDFEKIADIGVAKKRKLPAIALQPCLYKKR